MMHARRESVGATNTDGCVVRFVFGLTVWLVQKNPPLPHTIIRGAP